ncbi:MAG TPA: flagellar biosynthesis anti-sigma factor FlgM [Candidatus Binatia bacterium]|nr:flagellar biosynthesis anti-sigma factor FlgM [Candidatus Binatia bacterium]
MKIIGPSSNNVADVGARPASEKGSARPAATAHAGESGRVEVSDTARWLAELKTAVGDPLEIDQQRVADLRSAIADGRFAPTPRAIAESMLREFAELAGS